MIEQQLVLQSRPKFHCYSKFISSECFEGTVEDLFARYIHYRAMYELMKEIASETEIEAVPAKLLDKLNSLLHSERSLILLYGDSGDIAYQTGRNIHKDEIKQHTFGVSWRIINDVRESRKDLCLKSAFENPHFRSKSVLKFKILSVICVTHSSINTL